MGSYGSHFLHHIYMYIYIWRSPGLHVMGLIWESYGITWKSYERHIHDSLIASQLSDRVLNVLYSLLQVYRRGHVVKQRQGLLPWICVLAR